MIYNIIRHIKNRIRRNKTGFESFSNTRRDVSKWQRINRGETHHDEFVDEWKGVSNKDYKDYKKKDLTMKKNEDTAEDNHFDLLDQEEIK